MFNCFSDYIFLAAIERIIEVKLHIILILLIAPSHLLFPTTKAIL